jgi:hypothetical protein
MHRPRQGFERLVVALASRHTVQLDKTADALIKRKSINNTRH